MLFIRPPTYLNTMDVYETWEDQEIQFDLSVKYVRSILDLYLLKYFFLYLFLQLILFVCSVNKKHLNK